VHLGIDLGTSSLKLLALRDDGAVAPEHESPLRYDEPRPGWAEADPSAWTDAVLRGLAALLDVVPLGQVRGLGVTGHMHGAVLLDEEARPVRPAVLWPDSRARGLAARWQALSPELRARLGGPFSAGLTGPVLAWLADHEPASLDRAQHAVLAKDHVRLVLTGASDGTVVTDPSDASGTLLWDGSTGSWSDAALTAGGVPRRLLPDVVPSDQVVGTWRDRAVVAGAGDTPASLLALARGVGGFRPGDVVVNLGTGAQVISPVTAPPGDQGPLGWHCYADARGGHYAMVAILNGGLALSWAQERLGLDWSDFAAAAGQSPPGAGGVLFRPFVADERGDLRPTRQVGVGWDGTTGATTAERARAAAEAQAFLVRRAVAQIEPSPQRIWLIGGGAREGWVQQLVADTLHGPVTRVELRSAAALGAALLSAGADVSVPLTQRTVEPRELPELDEAYAAWHAACYGPHAG